MSSNRQPVCLSPPLLRHRASSTKLSQSRPLLSVDVEHPLPPPPLTGVTVPDDIPDINRSSMLALFLSRLLQALHFPVQPKDTSTYSSPSSPFSTADEFVLPLSASPSQATFRHSRNEKALSQPQPPNSTPRQNRLPSIHAPILLVVVLFPLSTAFVFFCLSTLPTSISWPRNLTDLAQLGRELHAYSQSGPGPMAHVFGVMSITAVWKHAWSIPGSIIWNVLGGVLFSPVLATVLLTALTTIGSACSTLLAMPLSPLLTRFFPRALDMTRSTLEGDPNSDSDRRSTSPTWVRLSVLRLIGVVPWSGINIACGVCGVSMADCLLGAFIGSLPWTAVTCQIGDILQTVASTPSPTPQSVSSLLVSPWIISKLALLSFLSLAPILARERLKAIIILRPGATTADGRISRWTWVYDRCAAKFRSRSPAHLQKELDVLVHEKFADSQS